MLNPDYNKIIMWIRKYMQTICQHIVLAATAASSSCKFYCTTAVSLLPYTYIYIYMAWNNGRQHFRGSECHIFKVTYFVTEPTFCILLGILQLFLKILVSAPSTKCILTRYGLSMAPFYGPKVSTFFHKNFIVFGHFLNKTILKSVTFWITTIY